MTRRRKAVLFRLGLLVAAATVAVSLSSCGSGRVAVYPVHGRVLDADGKPATGAQILFHPTGTDADGRLKAVALVDDDGEFYLTTHSAGDGAAPGAYVITLQWPTPRKQPFEKVGPDRLNGRYSDANGSPLRFTVEAQDDNEVPVIQLR
jgi:hypothetical protein